MQRGYDITRYALNSFGGAGGQHACLVADALGIKTVMLHPFSGLLSAYGMGLAERRALREATVALPLEDAPALDAAAATLEGRARADLLAQGVEPVRVEHGA